MWEYDLITCSSNEEKITKSDGAVATATLFLMQQQYLFFLLSGKESAEKCKTNYRQNVNVELNVEK
jgi:hypothetical protein